MFTSSRFLIIKAFSIKHRLRLLIKVLSLARLATENLIVDTTPLSINFQINLKRSDVIYVWKTFRDFHNDLWMEYLRYHSNICVHQFCYLYTILGVKHLFPKRHSSLLLQLHPYSALFEFNICLLCDDIIDPILGKQLSILS